MTIPADARRQVIGRAEDRSGFAGSHFPRDGVLILGRTSTGRATVAALSMNRPLALAIRREEVIRHRHPPWPHT